MIDYEYIEADLRRIAELFDIRECGYDRWGATQLVQRMGEEGVTQFVPMGQGYKSMSEPTKDLMARVHARGFRHDGDPVLAWAADNLVVMEDPAGNRKPAKDRSAEKIDPMVALIMAWDRFIRHNTVEAEEVGSVYEERGPILL